MAFKIQCPGCQSKLKLAAAPTKDVKLKCPKCEKVITVKATAPDGTGDEPKAAPAPKPTAAGKAAAKAKPKTTKTKAAAGKKKSKAKRAPVNDDWDDYEDLDGGDFDDFEDDFADDDYQDSKPSRGKKRKGGAAAAKGKGKAAPAKSGGNKKLMIGLGVLLGVGLIGGIIYGVIAMNGDDDSAIASNDDGGGGSTRPTAGGGADSNSTTGGGNDVANANVDGTGKNFTNLQYVPAQADAIIYANISGLMASPLMGKLKDALPAEAFAGQGNIGPDDMDDMVVAFWMPANAAQGNRTKSDRVIPVSFQNGMGQNGQFGGQGGQFGGPQPGMQGGRGVPRAYECDSPGRHICLHSAIEERCRQERPW